uniref:Uncharacterized protein n=1 Tax=viral metagenome TaxID=1070528 RepID=A0A6C0ARM5_9ZZZZ
MSTDSTGVLTAQNSYLSSIQNYSNSPSLTNNVNALQAELQNIYSNYGQVNQYSAQVLTNQQQMSDIINAESIRLQEKKTNIDSAIATRERVAELNESYRLRYIEYTKMTAVFVLALVLFGILQFLSKTFPIIPSLVIDLCYVALFCGTCIILYLIYLNIQSRDNLYFDKLRTNPPSSTNLSGIPQSMTDSSGNLFGSMNLGACIGKDCCSPGTQWDISNSYCVPLITAGTSKTISGFSTLSTCYYIGGGPNANSPSEITEYTKI